MDISYSSLILSKSLLHRQSSISSNLLPIQDIYIILGMWANGEISS